MQEARHHSDTAALVEHAAHLLPSQGPISVFVHHNTLHAFEDLEFDAAVKTGARTYDCDPYLPEARYRSKLKQGRFGRRDLEAVLIEDLGDSGEELIGLAGTRFHLRMAMLEHPLFTGEDAELRWLVDETDALVRFRPEASPALRRRSIDETREWALREFGNGSHHDAFRRTVEDLVDRYGRNVRKWDERTWETFSLHLLWRVCHQGVHGIEGFSEPSRAPIRHRDVVHLVTGVDVDELVNPVLIRFCAAFLDQGFAQWDLPERDAGFLGSFSSLYRTGHALELWLRPLREELERIALERLTAVDVIEESLRLLGVGGSEREAYVTETLLALRGWAGMVWQMETNAEWTTRPAPGGTLVEYLAVRLVLERLALEHVLREHDEGAGLSDLRSSLARRVPNRARVSVDERAYVVFQLAQVRGWTPLELHDMAKSNWSRLVEEIEAFSAVERSRVYHLAFERRYRIRALDAIVVHATRVGADPEARNRPSFQVLTCIDDREESLRRHLEEVAPDCETYGAAGFYAVAMYYRGAGGAHYKPLAPAIVKPRHFVREEVAYTFEELHARRTRTRRVVGRAQHQFHMGSRSILGGIGTALSGSLATIPLVLRTMFPAFASQLDRLVRGWLDPPRVTHLHLERTGGEPGPGEEQLGYTLDEMADIVTRILADTAAPQLAPVVIVLGHGSSSLNNPHESAYNCGACSGGRGGPNARALAQMANDLRVRERLAQRGFAIPSDTYFVGGYHDTCRDLVEFFDLERLPQSHREAFHAARVRINEACERDAHERCRRFESAPLSLSAERALRHVRERAVDLSQARPEYNHATNSLCIVGRRATTRGLFLDRRAFLNCYDHSTDDERATILGRILGAAIPVCAGISLEYYFSTVDVQGYGCGSKLPHNIASLLGVMEGAASDLRPGLSAQMVEIHEPLRILFVVETTPERMLLVMSGNPVVDRLVRNEWVQLATLDPVDRGVHVFSRDRFRPCQPESTELPSVSSSLEWYSGRRDHLGFASITGTGTGTEVAR